MPPITGVTNVSERAQQVDLRLNSLPRTDHLKGKSSRLNLCGRRNGMKRAPLDIEGESADQPLTMEQARATKLKLPADL